jgi:SAM domain (Sterile alpha motif)
MPHPGSGEAAAAPWFRRLTKDPLRDAPSPMRAIPSPHLSRNGLEPTNRICSPERCLRGCATVQEIGDWLERLGMPEYGECFAENKIDLSVLRCVATSRSPGCGQRIDVLKPLKRYFRRSSGGSSSSSSGVSRPSLSAPLIAQWFRLRLLFHVLAAASSSGSLAMFARLASSRVRLIARQRYDAAIMSAIGGRDGVIGRQLVDS